MKDPLKIIYEDRYLIVIDKSEGLLSVGTSRGKEEVTAHRILNNYLKMKYQGRGRSSTSPRAYIVHRLDRETSGLMVFAKSEDIKFMMQENWDKAVTMRGYVAVVNGRPDTGEKGEGTIRSWLKENRAYIVYSSPKDNGGQLATTHYKIIGENPAKRQTLVELELETGRKNQIRVHMQELGCPIYGDKKYYGTNEALLAENKKARRLYLHAHTLHFIHPVTGKEMKFTTGIPHHFMEGFK